MCLLNLKLRIYNVDSHFIKHTDNKNVAVCIPKKEKAFLR